jgi:hypothetical protein
LQNWRTKSCDHSRRLHLIVTFVAQATMI